MNQNEIEEEILFLEKKIEKIKNRMKFETDEVELMKLKKRILECCEIIADLSRTRKGQKCVKR